MIDLDQGTAGARFSLLLVGQPVRARPLLNRLDFPRPFPTTVIVLATVCNECLPLVANLGAYNRVAPIETFQNDAVFAAGVIGLGLVAILAAVRFTR